MHEWLLPCRHIVKSSDPVFKQDLVIVTLSVRCHCCITVFWLQERLDFSCAMFGPSGGLVANGPHVPMHLGSMQETVKYQVFY